MGEGEEVEEEEEGEGEEVWEWRLGGGAVALARGLHVLRLEGDVRQFQTHQNLNWATRSLAGTPQWLLGRPGRNGREGGIESAVWLLQPLDHPHRWPVHCRKEWLNECTVDLLLCPYCGLVTLAASGGKTLAQARLAWNARLVYEA